MDVGPENGGPVREDFSPVRGASGPVRFLRKSGNLYEKIGQIFCLKIY